MIHKFATKIITIQMKPQNKKSKSLIKFSLHMVPLQNNRKLKGNRTIIPLFQIPIFSSRCHIPEYKTRIFPFYDNMTSIIKQENPCQQTISFDFTNPYPANKSQRRYHAHRPECCPDTLTVPPVWKNGARHKAKLHSRQ